MARHHTQSNPKISAHRRNDRRTQRVDSGSRLGVTEVLASHSSAHLFCDTLTRGQKRALSQRLVALNTFGTARKAGLTQECAARKAGFSATTFWRYTRHIWDLGLDAIIPATANCGRASALKKLGVTARVANAVKRIQKATGCGNAAAWFAYARRANCPSAIADYLKTANVIPPSLFDATRIAPKTRHSDLPQSGRAVKHPARRKALQRAATVNFLINPTPKNA